MPVATRTAWTEAQKRNSRAEYARLYASNHAHNGKGVTVPEDVERVEVSAPCTWCGVARACRHRPWLAVAHG